MAVAVANKLELEVVLVHGYHVAFNPTANSSDVIADVREEADHYLENAAAQVKKLGGTIERYVAKEGMAGDEIIAVGSDTADTLIAMCSHGRTGMERWALCNWTLPSFAERVVRHADEPVVMVRAA